MPKISEEGQGLECGLSVTSTVPQAVLRGVPAPVTQPVPVGLPGKPHGGGEHGVLAFE